jgi:phosphoribosylformylglycinamidine cyclo-ligase
VTYRDAGVDLVGADRHVAAIASTVTSTWTDNVVGGCGGLAAGVTIPPGYTNPVLMLSTDGVGTKLDLARRSGLVVGESRCGLAARGKT